MRAHPRLLPVALAALLLSGCATDSARVESVAGLAPRPAYHGTLEPMAADAVYFVVTDRFVNGDPGNDHRDQGGAHRTFDIPLAG